MMNPLSITAVHSIHRYVLLDKGLTKVLLIMASSTWAQNFDILTEFSLNEAHKLFDTINVFCGKHSPMHPTLIHPIKLCRKPPMNNSAPIQKYTFNRVKEEKSVPWLYEGGGRGIRFVYPTGQRGSWGHGGMPVPHLRLCGCTASWI